MARMAVITWGLALAVFASFLFVTAVNRDPDLGWHLAVGERILADRAVPRADIYSHTMPGYPWVDHEWLQEAGLAWFSAHGLWPLVQMLFALLAFLPFAVWLWRSRSLIELGLVLLAAALMVGFIGVRPQVVSFTLFFLAFELVNVLFRDASASSLRMQGSYRDVKIPAFPPLSRRGGTTEGQGAGMTDGRASGNGRKELWSGFGLIVLFFLWANLHAGFIAGLALFGIYVAVEFGSAVLRGERVGNRAMFRLSVLIASAIATLVNPYGFGLHREIIAVLASPYVSGYILEWQSALNFPSISAALFMGTFVFFAVRFWRAYPPALLLASAFFFFSYIRAVRMAPQFLALALPVLRIGLDKTRALLQQEWSAHPPQPRLRHAVLIAREAFPLLTTLALLSAIAWYPYPSLPERAVRALRAEHRALREVVLVNDYGWGGYLIRNLPEVPVFIDGRMPHWVGRDGSSAMADYVAIFYGTDDAARREALERRGATVALIASRNRAAAGKLVQALAQRPLIRAIAERLVRNRAVDLRAFLLKDGWRVVYEDAVAAALARP